MGTYTTKHAAGDSVFYINTEFQAQRGLVASVMVQEQLIPTRGPSGKEVDYQLAEDGKSLRTQTYVQYMIDGQNMHEGRVFSSIEDLVEHVRGDSK